MTEIEYIGLLPMNRQEHRIVSERLSFSIRHLKDTIDDLTFIELLCPVDYDIQTLKAVYNNLQEKYVNLNREDTNYE